MHEVTTKKVKATREPEGAKQRRKEVAEDAEWDEAARGWDEARCYPGVEVSHGRENQQQQEQCGRQLLLHEVDSLEVKGSGSEFLSS